jgi:hypothetical protein
MNFGSLPTLPAPIATSLGAVVDSAVYFDKDRGSDGPTVGKYLLTLVVGILGGMVPNLMSPEFRQNWVAEYKLGLHALLAMVILTNVLSNIEVFDRYDRVIGATVLLYLWFVLLIKCRPQYIAMVLGALALTQVLYRIRRGLEPGSKYIRTLKSLEVYITLAAMLATIYCVVRSNPEVPLMKVPQFVLADVLPAGMGYAGGTAFGGDKITPTSDLVGEGKGAYGSNYETSDY